MKFYIYQKTNDFLFNCNEQFEGIIDFIFIKLKNKENNYHLINIKIDNKLYTTIEWQSETQTSSNIIATLPIKDDTATFNKTDEIIYINTINYFTLYNEFNQKIDFEYIVLIIKVK